jgi:hypothetical protein
MTVLVAGGNVRKRFTMRVGGTPRAAARARSAALAGPLLIGQLGCYPPPAELPFFKTVTSGTPWVAAVNRTTGRDVEYVWWITRLFVFDGANILNGTGWHAEPTWPTWSYTLADDAQWMNNWWEYGTNAFAPLRFWSALEGQEAEAVANWAYFSSTGAWVSWWSSDAAAVPVQCGAQGYISPKRS